MNIQAQQWKAALSEINRDRRKAFGAILATRNKKCNKAIRKYRKSCDKAKNDWERTHKKLEELYKTLENEAWVNIYPGKE